jgi:MFS family permease
MTEAKPSDGAARRLTAPVLVSVLCFAEILGMTGFSAFAALLPGFRAEWGLSNAEAGWIEGMFQAGYLVAVPVLVSLADRVDPRRIYLLSMLAGVAATLGFALFADGLWSASLLRAIGGISLAGTFMPGLKILSDRMSGAAQSRAVAFYTACFSVGSSLSILLAGLIADGFGWRWAFATAAACALAAFTLVLLAVPSTPYSPTPRGRARLLDFRPVLRNRPSLAYSLAYAAHMWELYGFRAWLVAFLTLGLSSSGASGAMLEGPSVTTLAAAILLLGLPASILGNEAALRYGRRRVVAIVMAVSAGLALAVGLSTALPFAVAAALCALYSMTVSADSASLTAGAVGNAARGHVGSTMAMHSLIGFAAATLSPLAFGAMLDLGEGSARSWFGAFALLGAGVATGPLLLWRLRK